MTNDLAETAMAQSSRVSIPKMVVEYGKFTGCHWLGRIHMFPQHLGGGG